jgi:hypothetical protein
VRQAESDIGTFASSEAEYVTKNDTLLDYYYELSGVGAEFDIFLTVRECINQINNARSKLKDVVNNAVELRTQLKTFSFKRNSSQEKTEGLPNAHGKSLDVKYEDIYNRILYIKAN